MASKTLLQSIHNAFSQKSVPKSSLFGSDYLHSLQGNDRLLADLIGLERDETMKEQQINTDINDSSIELPILRAYHPLRKLKQKDFQNLYNDVPLQYFIKGRYLNSLIPTDTYFLFFHSIDDLRKYYNHYKEDKMNQTINSLNVNLTPISTHDFVEEFRFSYPQFLPDLQDLPLSIATINKRLSIVENQDLSQSLSRLLKNRQNAMYRYKHNGKKKLLGIAMKLKEDQSPNIKITQGTTPIDRSCCVVFKNVPANIAIRKIEDFFWDLSWFPDQERRIRPIFTSKNSNLTSYILVFADQKSASVCVNRGNNQHLFYNPVLPIVESELL